MVTKIILAHGYGEDLVARERQRGPSPRERTHEEDQDPEIPAGLAGRLA